MIVATPSEDSPDSKRGGSPAEASASAAAAIWLEQLRVLAQQAPHRLMAHVYVRYGGDTIQLAPPFST